VLTHTSPCPPPAAGVAVAVAAAPDAAEGDALTELLGLKKSASVFFAGDGDEVTVGETAAVVLLLRACFSVGDGEASAVAAGEGEVSPVAVFSLRARFPFGEAEGDSALEGDAAPSAGEAVAAAFLCVRCFAGEGDAAGDPLGVGD
jgi:hypothetical protein